MGRLACAASTLLRGIRADLLPGPVKGSNRLFQDATRQARFREAHFAQVCLHWRENHILPPVNVSSFLQVIFESGSGFGDLLHSFKIGVTRHPLEDQINFPKSLLDRGILDNLLERRA